ncbi:MAG: D-isomer specific 2-hydroxyacid dehydrogenase NAD-binding, glyoxylate reductase [candidate division WWE3 bacterium GW2011_GWC1_47_10]|uniref:D-isomer specific 2-hydroxyacid dehydrogenase NAD-binding, glyoxylate reductase n=1 Tax=candidate division WWE3 bacterium GW2011_GWC1_47_10 TaxID=1619122 RepID=A0A0G1T9A0_UNCKA|nr:MAG: D-isomer specific 2-hydroxyacid dehydrogenase NAD-binding, glyoxylate reductase [candidate division WWE3 bacterium GW2011_GWC1_47_10]
MKVLVTREIPRAGIELLKKRPALELDIRKGPPLSDKDLKKAAVGTSAILCVIPDKITKEVMQAASPTLKLVSTYSVGYDHIDTKAASELGIYVTNTPGDLAQSVAEHSMALLMAVARKIVEADKFMTEKRYKYWDPMIFIGPVLEGKTIGIIGFGRIGQKLAKIAKGGFNMRVLYHDINRDDKAELETGAMYVGLDDLLEKSDFISLHVPLMPSTNHIIGERELKKMKPNAYLINTSRGPVVDEDALAKALKENWIEGAGIDVYENEPNVYPLLRKIPNAILTPHIGSATREARIEMARMAAESIIEVLVDKKSPTYLVNKDIKSPRV